MSREKKWRAIEEHRSPEDNELYELRTAQQRLIEAEAELAEEQAQVNAFRMQCRLKLEPWIDQLLELQTERQSLLTRIRLLMHEQGMKENDQTDDFWGDDPATDSEESEELILPTDVPRDKAAEKRLYRELARRFHPDLGATAVDIAYRTEMMAAVNRAYDLGDTQALYDLSDQLDPDQLARLDEIASITQRKIQTQIVRLQQRRRKAGRRLAALRRENTARLWRKARRLDRDDTHWWEIVRGEIESAIAKVEGDIVMLRTRLEMLARS